LKVVNILSAIENLRSIIHYELFHCYAEAMATDQPDTTSTSYRSTALYINENRLMYRSLYQQICSSDQLLYTSTNIAKNLKQREKRL
jgi:hypothetical protein